MGLAWNEREQHMSEPFPEHSVVGPGRSLSWVIPASTPLGSSPKSPSEQGPSQAHFSL